MPFFQNVLAKSFVGLYKPKLSPPSIYENTLRNCCPTKLIHYNVRAPASFDEVSPQLLEWLSSETPLESSGRLVYCRSQNKTTLLHDMDEISFGGVCLVYLQCT